MSARAAMDDRTLYDTDIVAWAEQQAAALRLVSASPAVRSNGVDWDNLVEEIESLGRSQLRAVESKLTLIFVHLMKIVSDPDASALLGGRAEITSFQRVVRKEFTPAMKSRLNLEEIWREALKEAEAALFAYGASVSRKLPRSSPFTLEDLTSPEFDAQSALDTLTKAMGACPL
jgi:hypothetical protein